MERWLVADGALVDGALRPVAVRVGGGRITAIAPAPTDHAVVTRLPGRVLLPGFVNAHSHAFQRGLRGHVQHAALDATGRPSADSFWTWRERMYALAGALDPEGIEAVSALAFVEMARAGYTTVGEFHYVHHQADGTPYTDPDELARRVYAAGERVGIRVVLLRVAYARAGFGVAPNPRQRRFIDREPGAVLAAIERLGGEGRRVGLAVHSVRACPGEWLRELGGYGGVVHAHVDEQPAEIEACLAEHGARPVHVLADAGLVHERFTAVHLTHPDGGEIERMRAAGAAVCVCPTTELDLGDGFLPAEALDGVPIAIGSDSHARIDPFAEIRAIELHTRARLGRRNVLPHVGQDGLAVRLLGNGAGDGARALGVPDTGEIRVGMRADLVGVRGGLVTAGARPLPALVFAGHAGLVSDVWVEGRAIVEDGRHAEEEAIVRAAERVLAAV